jgi:hypothetical protein
MHPVFSAGSPGPLESIIPSGSDSSISSAVTSYGKISTLQPRFCQLQRYVAFGAVIYEGHLEFFPARCRNGHSLPAADGGYGAGDGILPYGERSAGGAEQIMAFITPFSRIRRVSALVSTPQMPGTPLAF